MKTVLITGVTGAIGSAVARVFLAEDSANLVFLIRAESDRHLRERLDDLFAFWDLGPDDSAFRDRVRAYRGDVGHRRLGLSEADYGALAGTVTHIVHCAGNVRLNQAMDEARKHTLEPLRHVVALAEAAGSAGVFQKLDVLSTVGVAGRRPGRLAEAPLDRPRAFHNTYEQAKAEAEALLFRHMKAGFPVTIHRPSMVIGDSATGKIVRFQVFYYLCEFLAGRKTFGCVPDTGEHSLDVIPCDYVARAIHMASSRQETIGRIFHLCSGPDRAIRLFQLVRDVRSLFQQAGSRVPRLRTIPVRRVRRWLPLVTRLVSGRLRRSLRTLPHFLAYLDEAQAFDNTLSAAYFERQGLALPSPEAVLPVVLGYYLDATPGRPETAPSKMRGVFLRNFQDRANTGWRTERYENGRP